MAEECHIIHVRPETYGSLLELSEPEGWLGERDRALLRYAHPQLRLKQQLLMSGD